MSLAPIAVERYAIQYKEMSGLLLDFRRYLERENGGLPVQQLELECRPFGHFGLNYMQSTQEQIERFTLEKALI